MAIEVLPPKISYSLVFMRPLTILAEREGIIKVECHVVNYQKGERKALKMVGY
jgi:hypothetical protein